MKRLITLCLLGSCFLSAPAQNYVSQAWVADQGNGTYKNPVLYPDYSDPDICRVGNDYYLTSSLSLIHISGNTFSTGVSPNVTGNRYKATSIILLISQNIKV